MRPGRSALLAPAAIVVSMLLLGACGGGSNPQSSAGSRLAQAGRLAACMRTHGLPAFPDPVAQPNGDYMFNLPTGMNPGLPRFQAAQQACHSLLPGQTAGGGPFASAARQQALLAWAACIRSHGVPEFPDPKFSNGVASLIFRASRYPQLPAAERACQLKRPAG